MSEHAVPDDRREPLLLARVRAAPDVVSRSFGDDSVALNLRSGQYYGLNDTAAVMLDTLVQSPSVADAVRQLSTRWPVARDQLREDVLDLCEALVERGLIEVDAPVRTE
jgi:hypothetical protein